MWAPESCSTILSIDMHYRICCLHVTACMWMYFSSLGTLAFYCGTLLTGVNFLVAAGRFPDPELWHGPRCVSEESRGWEGKDRFTTTGDPSPYNLSSQGTDTCNLDSSDPVIYRVFIIVTIRFLVNADCIGSKCAPALPPAESSSDLSVAFRKGWISSL